MEASASLRLRKLLSGPRILSQSVRAPDRRRVPSAVGDLRLRRIEPKRQSEHAAPWRRKPIRFFIRAGVFVLDVEVERAVSAELERIAVADRESVQRIGDLESLLVVKRQRPERVHWRQFVLREMEDIFASSSDRLAVRVTHVKGIDRILD